MHIRTVTRVRPSEATGNLGQILDIFLQLINVLTAIERFIGGGFRFLNKGTA